jgi:hypothetical protein
MRVAPSLWEAALAIVRFLFMYLRDEFWIIDSDFVTLRVESTFLFELGCVEAGG